MPTLPISPKSPLHAKIVERVKSRFDLADEGQAKRHDRWTRAEELTLAYLPEIDADAGRRARRDQGTPSYTTIQIPYSFAQLMAAHTYWTSVFFARSPIHQFMGLHGEAERQTQAVEALIGYQVEVGQMVAPYYIWLYDAGKYGLGILGDYWDVEKVHYGQIVEMADPMTGQVGIYQSTMEMVAYQGNKVYNVSPFDFMHDPRVPIGRFQEGEFCFVRKRLGWNKIIQRRDAGFFTNIDLIKEHVSSDQGRNLGSSQLERPDFSRTMNDGDRDQHPAGGVFWEMYVDIIPREWGLGTTSYPQKWCITVTEDRELVVGCTPLGNLHAKFPFSILEPEIEGYGLFNRGIPEIMEPIQNTIDWLINSHFWNVRAAMNNQFIVDPSKLVIKDATRAGPGFFWRLRPEAYGTDLSKMFMQVPVQDVTRGHIADVPFMQSFGERVLGVNDQLMGAMSGNNRKTATEVRTTTGFGVNRQKTVAEWMSTTGFSPHARRLVQNSQQLYTGEMKLRIVGDLMLEAGQGFMQVTPDMIAGSFGLVPVDGVLPIDRMAQANLWKEIFAGVGRMPPQIVMGFDWTRIFAWAATLAGLKNINQFRVQLVPNEVAAQGAAAGNVIPLRPPGNGVTPGNAASTMAGLPALNGGGNGVPGAIGPAGY